MSGDRPDCRQYRMSRGLTLLEVIVAMALLSLGITGVLGALSACLRSAEAASSYSRGALLAQQVAAELERSESLDAGSIDGTFDDLSIGYVWQADVEEADEQGMHAVRITVVWHEGLRQYDLYTTVWPRAVPDAPRPRTSAPAGRSEGGGGAETGISEGPDGTEGTGGPGGPGGLGGPGGPGGTGGMGGPGGIGGGRP